MALRLRNKGQAEIAQAIAVSSIVMIVAIVVLGNLFTTATTSTASSTVATAAVGNVTNYTWSGVVLLGIGLVVVAGMGLISIMVGRR